MALEVFPVSSQKKEDSMSMTMADLLARIKLTGDACPVTAHDESYYSSTGACACGACACGGRSPACRNVKDDAIQGHAISEQ
jgi:hypothetical protein